MLFYQKNIDDTTQLAIWKIEEPESFYLEKVSLQKEISHPKSRIQHLAGRYLLQHIIPNFPYHEIEISNTKKPYLVSEKYHFSISHSDQYAAAIISTAKNVGIDIELLSPKVLRVTNKFINEAEKLKFNTLDKTEMTTIWCCKEAIYKWWSHRDISLKSNMNIERIHEYIDATLFTTHQDFELNIEYQQFSDFCLCYIAQ